MLPERRGERIAFLALLISIATLVENVLADLPALTSLFQRPGTPSALSTLSPSTSPARHPPTQRQEAFTFDTTAVPHVSDFLGHGEAPSTGIAALFIQDVGGDRHWFEGFIDFLPGSRWVAREVVVGVAGDIGRRCRLHAVAVSRQDADGLHQYEGVPYAIPRHVWPPGQVIASVTVTRIAG